MSIEKPSVDYSIVICTYNPDERLLNRCLTAVINLEKTDITFEVILVDNNSAKPVEQLACVQASINKLKNFCILHVTKQGVGHSRMAAIKKASGNYIVYFDYDNEPQCDYLLELKKLNNQYPEVAACGPGNIWVDFIDGIDRNIESYARTAFQEKHIPRFSFSNIKEWQDIYPFGTGLCTKSSLLREYVEEVNIGKYTMPGRTGNKLIGGEDTQMVLHCLRKGYFAGSSPSLNLKHIIPANRANISYLKRLIYNTSLDYHTCLLQVFPEQKENLETSCMSEAKFSRRSLKKFLRVMFASDQTKIFDFIRFIGINEGLYKAIEKPVPRLVHKIVSFLKLA
ncbi:glycosyltransferase [Olivibacter domesticus]|uniref:glycosyltransferase n=1 Tax=Olivibacter domesticus TaxID=407022 RepID=UPI00360BD174